MANSLPPVATQRSIERSFLWVVLYSFAETRLSMPSSRPGRADPAGRCWSGRIPRGCRRGIEFSALNDAEGIAEGPGAEVPPFFRSVSTLYHTISIWHANHVDYRREVKGHIDKGIGRNIPPSRLQPTKTKKGLNRQSAESLNLLVAGRGFEPLTLWL